MSRDEFSGFAASWATGVCKWIVEHEPQSKQTSIKFTFLKNDRSDPTEKNDS